MEGKYLNWDLEQSDKMLAFTVLLVHEGPHPQDKGRKSDVEGTPIPCHHHAKLSTCYLP